MNTSQEEWVSVFGNLVYCETCHKHHRQGSKAQKECQRVKNVRRLRGIGTEEILDKKNLDNDYTEVIDSALKASLSGDAELYNSLMDEATKIAATRKEWEHLVMSKPEKMERLAQWQNRYQQFREERNLRFDKFANRSITDRYRNVEVDEDQMEEVYYSLLNAHREHDYREELRQNYRRRIQGDESIALRVDNSSPEIMQPDDYKMAAVISQGVWDNNVPFGTMMKPATEQEMKVAKNMAAWGLFKDHGQGQFSINAEPKDFMREFNELRSRAEGNIPQSPIGGSKYIEGDKYRSGSESEARSSLVSEDTIAMVPGGEIEKMTPDEIEKYILENIKLRELPVTVDKFRIEATGEIVHINPDGRLATLQSARKRILEEGSEPEDHELVNHLRKSGFLPLDYNEVTRRKYYSGNDNPYNHSMSDGTDQGPLGNPDISGGGGGGRVPPRNGNNTSPTPPPRRPQPGGQEGNEGDRRSSGGQGHQSARDTGKKRNPTSSHKSFMDGERGNSPLLKRTTSKVESMFGLTGFATTRLTGRKRVGPFVVNTGIGGVAGISSVSLKLGPMMWSVWSKDYESGFSSLDLPGWLSLRGNRTRKGGKPQHQNR